MKSQTCEMCKYRTTTIAVIFGLFLLLGSLVVRSSLSSRELTHEHCQLRRMVWEQLHNPTGSDLSEWMIKGGNLPVSATNMRRNQRQN